MMSAAHLTSTAASLHTLGREALLRRWLARCLRELRPLFPDECPQWDRVERALTTLDLGLPPTEVDRSELAALWNASMVPSSPGCVTSGPLSDQLFECYESLCTASNGPSIHSPRNYGNRISSICQTMRWKLRSKDIPAEANWSTATYPELLKHRKRMRKLADELINDLPACKLEVSV